jgi:hypothetical protein
MTTASKNNKMARRSQPQSYWYDLCSRYENGKFLNSDDSGTGTISTPYQTEKHSMECFKKSSQAIF